MRHHISTTGNGLDVFVDLVASSAAAQIAHQPHLLHLASSLLASSQVEGEHIWLEHDLGHTIGVCDIIETSPKDIIFYAQRSGSEAFSRFVKNRQLQQTSLLSLELTRLHAQAYELQQIIVGPPLPSLPGEGEETETRTFWENHALLWGDWPVKSRTTTRTCPW